LSKRISVFYDDTDPLSGDHLGFQLHGDRACVSVGNEFDQIERLTGQLPPSVRDLVDIAAGTYVADLFNEPDSRMYREFRITAKVRDIDVWKENNSTLNTALSFLTRSPVHFDFVNGKNDQVPAIEGQDDFRLKNVICFSGGLDSYLGVCKLKNEKDTALVSHYNHGSLSSLQRKVSSRISRKIASKHFQIFVGQGKNERRRRDLGPQLNSLQSSRSFLFLALAGAIAIKTGAKRISMFENGPIALGIPYTPSRISTRTVHPVFLDFMERLLHKIPGGENISIENPFQKKTKTDILLNQLEPVLRNVNATCSCSHMTRVNLMKSRLSNSELRKGEYHHCGICIPCINRRISVLCAGKEKWDDQYLIDFLSEYPFNDLGSDSMSTEAMLNIQDSIVFARHFREDEASDVFERYPELFFESNRLSPNEALKLEQRWADQFLDTIQEHAGKRLKEDLSAPLEN